MSITRSQIARQMYANGALVDPRMANTLEQNKAINNAATLIANARRSGGQQGVANLLSQNFPGISNPNQVPGFTFSNSGFTGTYRAANDQLTRALAQQLNSNVNANTVVSSYREPPKPPTDMFGILISDHDKYGPGSDPTKVSEADMNAFRQRVLDAQKNYYQKELDLINQDYISSGYPDQAMTLEEYMRSIGAYAKGGRAGFANGGRGYSDYASPSSTTASQDFATQATSGGTDWGGNNEVQYYPTVQPNRITTTSDFDTNVNKATRTLGILGAGMNLVKTLGAKSLMSYPGAIAALEFYNAIKGNNQNYAEGGRIGFADGSGYNPTPIIAEAPSDVENTPSDFDEAMIFGQNPYGYTGAMQRFAEGGEVRQAYGLGKLVRKITKPIKKIAKSDIGKAALTAAALYGLGTYLGGTKAFSGSGTISPWKRFKNPKLLKNLISPQFLTSGETTSALSTVTPTTGANAVTAPFGRLNLEAATAAAEAAKPTPTLINKAITYAKDNPFPTVFGLSSLAGLSAAGEEDESLDGISDRTDTSGLKELIARYPELRFQLQPQYQLAANGGRMGYEEGGNIDPADLPMSKEGFPTYEDIETEEEVEYPYKNKKMASEPNIDAELFQMYLDAIGSGKIPRSTTFDQYKELMEETASMGPERTMANEGGLMNLGGKEMDLRGGGFVPLGAREKADDVPARLSKNEFVFTADAVRAAGGGDVDRGADLMYKTMKDLESRVG
jgi:hypothetical protein